MLSSLPDIYEIFIYLAFHVMGDKVGVTVYTLYLRLQGFISYFARVGGDTVGSDVTLHLIKVFIVNFTKSFLKNL